MAQLKLWFSKPNSLELLTTEFRLSSEATPLKTVRGKTSGAFTGAGTFQWSSGVQALCLLLLKEKCSSLIRSSSEQRVSLVGERGSAAASLDYALAKKPSWLHDFFGTDSKGTPFALRLFHRSNPERKRAGPVVIGLNHSLLSAEAIHILVDGHEVNDHKCLQELVTLLDRGFEPKSGINIGELLRQDRFEGLSYNDGEDGLKLSFGSIVELDSFFTGLNTALLRKMKESDLVVGEGSHYWWPLINSEKERSQAQSVSNYSRMRYSCRGQTQFDDYVSRFYRRIGISNRIGTESTLQNDFWVYGRSVIETIYSESLRGKIQRFFSSSCGPCDFDQERFRAEVLNSPGEVTLAILNKPSLSESLRSHVLSGI